MFGRRFYGLKGGVLNGAVCAICGVVFIMFGYNQGLMGGLLTQQTFLNRFPEIDMTLATNTGQLHHLANIQGITVACLNAGCCIGAIWCIFWGDWLGRKKTIFLGTLIMALGAIIQTSSYSLGQLIAGRAIIGVGNGINTASVPIYIAETSKSHRRGQLMLLEGACIAGGAALAYWVNFGFSYTQPSSISWRFPIALQLAFEILVLTTILFLPESPRWLILFGREDEALTVLGALNNCSPSDQLVRNEFMAIKEAVLTMLGGNWNIFSQNQDRYFHRTVLAYMVQVLQQISGINLIVYYAPWIYQMQWRRSNFNSKILGACNISAYFLCALTAVLVIERMGRRPLMLFGSAGMSICMIVLAVMEGVGGNAEDIVGTVFMFLFVAFFALGWLGIGWLYPTEIVPLKIRGPANALACTANWLFNFMVVMITPVVFTRIGYRTWVIWAAINAVTVPIIYFLYPETAYRSLEEMDAIFQKTGGWFNAVLVARNEPHQYNKNGEPMFNRTRQDYEKMGSDRSPTSSDSVAEKAYFPGASQRINGQSFHGESRVKAKPPVGQGRKMRVTLRDGK